MADPRSSPTTYLTAEDVERLHSFIVEGDDDTESGVANRGAIEYATSAVEDGHFGKRPDTIHEAAFELMRLLVANHPFVDGNKRTALLSTVAFYAVNGYEFEYDREIKRLLKQLATDESSVNPSAAAEQFAAQTSPFEEQEWGENASIVAILEEHFRRRSYIADEDEPNDNGH